MTVVVTGATGALGGAVAAALAADGVPVRLVVRDAARAPSLPGAEVTVAASYDDEPGLEAAFRGATAVLFVSAHESATRVDEHRTVARALAAAGAGHVVYTSFLGAAADATFTLGRDHGHTEAAIRESGVPFTFLRDSFYADLLPHFAGPDHVVRGPAGDGRCAFVARADVARAAAAVLRAPADHAGRTYELTGPEALTLTEAMARLAAATGVPYAYEPETVEVAYERRRRAWPGEPDWQYDAWVSTYTAIADGELDVVSGDVELLTGAPATPVG